MTVLTKLLNLLPRALRERIVLGRIKAALRRAGVPAKESERIMKGWKTWAGGLALIGGGIAAIGATVAKGEFSMDDIMNGIGMIGAGFAALGLGHKLEKNTDAVKEQTVAAQATTNAVQATTSAVKAQS